MTVLTEPVGSRRDLPEEMPRKLVTKPSGADRVFNGLLAGSSATVLILLVAVVAFLGYHGWPALHRAGFGLLTDPTWSPDSGQFRMWPLLVGSFAIAIVGVAIALPISLATALMINEYAPRKLRPTLIMVIDALATVPSIVYGFWGLLLISNLQEAPARWLVHNVAFIPIFRTAQAGQYGKSIFACGLISAITIIPIITSISREVMAQAPRDVCEAALGLGSTRWGMVTDVVLPFSRNGIIGASLLGFGRGLGETMIVALVLSSDNRLTSDLMGPGGLGSIAAEIANNFPSVDPLYKSALVLLGLVLFVATLVVNALARVIVQRTAAA